MSDGAVVVWVVGLSLAGMVLELVGVLVVSGRWDTVKKGLRIRRRSAPSGGVIGPAGAALENDVLVPSTGGADEARAAETRALLLDATTEATRQELAVVAARLDALEARADRIEEELPDEIRRRSLAPVTGVILLLAGLACFVAANILGVTA